eukprot:455371_1
MKILNIMMAVNAVICTFFVMLGIIIDCIQFRKLKSKDETAKPTILPLIYRVLTISLMSIYLTETASITAMKLDMNPEDAILCGWWHRINVILYHITRYMLYALLILRLHISFNGSIFGYSVKFVILPLYITIIIFFISQLIADTFGVSGYYNEKRETCAPLFAFYVVAMSGCIDFIYSVLSLILFIRPLIYLNKIEATMSQMPQIQDANKTSDQCKKNTLDTNPFAELIPRYALLVIISIGSTLILHFVILVYESSTDITNPLDNVINVWCVILINKANIPVYNKLCWCCKGMIQKCYMDKNIKSKKIQRVKKIHDEKTRSTIDDTATVPSNVQSTDTV